MKAYVLGKCTYLPAYDLTPAETDRARAAGFRHHMSLASRNCTESCVACEQGDVPDMVWWHTDPRAALRLGATFVHGEPARRAADPSRAITSELTVPCPAGRSFREYQLAAIEYAAKRKHVLIADEMGIGKTAEAIGVVNYLGAPRRILVVCPATLKENWRREIQAWDALTGDAFICDRASDLPTLSSFDRMWIITNPDRLIVRQKRKPAAQPEQEEKACEAEAGPSAAEPEKPEEDLWNALMAIAWDVLIIDEAHRLKNPKAARTPRILGARKTRTAAAAPGLAQRSHRVLALTGTPVPNRVRDLWPLLSVLDPTMFKNEGEFLFRHCGAKREDFWTKGPNGPEQKSVWNFGGASNLGELQVRLRKSCMVRRLKQDVLTELPAKTRQIIPLDGSTLANEIDAERTGWLKLSPKLAQARADALVAEAMQDAFEIDEALERLSAEFDKLDIASIAEQRQALARAKVPIVLELARDALEQTDKIVVMAHHISVISELTEAFEKEGFGPRQIFGDISLEKRQLAVDDFQTNSQVRVLVGGLHAAGVGITLTAASQMIFAESDWRHDVLSQCEDRIHRLGQTQPVLIQYPVVDGSIEALVVTCALRKQRIAEQALDVKVDMKARKQWPKASVQDRELCRDALEAWTLRFRIVADSKLDRSLREPVRAMIQSLIDRSRVRLLTDGEIWLCKRLIKDNRKTLPDLRGCP